MNCREKITVVVPTHCREQLLERSVGYYGSIGVAVVVVDSSPIPTVVTLPENIRYLHLPDHSFQKKIAKGLDLAETPYACICADDDFLTKSGLESGASFLDKNADFSGVGGRYVSFNKTKYGLEIRSCYDESEHFILEEKSASDRIKSAFGKNFSMIYSVFRTAVLRSAMEVANSVEEITVSEIAVALIAAQNGKFRNLGVFLGARDEKRYSAYLTVEGDVYRGKKVEAGATATVVVTDWRKYLASAKGLMFRTAFANYWKNGQIGSSFEEGLSVFDAAIGKYIAEIEKKRTTKAEGVFGYAAAAYRSAMFRFRRLYLAAFERVSGSKRRLPEDLSKKIESQQDWDTIASCINQHSLS